MHKKFHLLKRSRDSIASSCKYIFSNAQNLYYLTVSIATIIAGIWAYHLFIFERNPQAHLALDVGITILTNIPDLGERRLVFLDVMLANEGKRQLEAKRVSTNEVAYEDADEILKYSCGVEIRKIQTSLILTNKSLDWFTDTNELQCPDGIPAEIDLLGEYELATTNDPSINGTPAFWIEPNEHDHLGTTLILSKGNYLLKIHFIGNDTDDDFWSRIVYMQVR